MNYLLKNLNNSLTLPFDVIKIIYEYADPFIYIKKQIENKSYKLFISYRVHREDVCCIPNHYSIDFKKCLMISQLRTANVLNDNKYKMKDVYKKWLKL